MNNIFEKHIVDVQKKFRKYTNMILKSKYDSEISNELIQTYIDARYYNFDIDDRIKVFYRRIYDSLRKKANKMIEADSSKKEVIENTLSLFQYYFYFDGVRKNPDVNKIIDSIVEMRLFTLKLKSAINDDFKNEFTKLVLQDLVDNENELSKYDSDDFSLDVKKVASYNNEFYRVNLTYNFPFPKLFNKDAIDEVFNTGIIGEDKLFVEYPMVASMALKDVIEGNFKKKYIVDVSIDLMKKSKKFEKVLEIIDNQAAQDKICFEITYDLFKNYQNDIFKLMKRGFKFVLLTNEDMPKLTNEALKYIELFSCVIINSEDINKSKYNNLKKILI